MYQNFKGCDFMIITSLTNQHVLYACSLKEKKYRDKENKFLIEGDHLLQMAPIESIECLFTTDLTYQASYPIYYVTPEVLEKIAYTKTPQNKIAIVKKLHHTIDYHQKKYLLLDHVSDPGNLGSILRTALAFQIDYVVLSLNSVDIYNDKVIRSSQGAIFKCKFVYANLLEVMQQLKENNIVTYASTLSSNSINLTTLKQIQSFALIVGNEGSGISLEILKAADVAIKIAHSAAIDSLNVSVATAIMLYYFDAISK